MRIGLQIPNFTLGVPDNLLFEAVVEQAVTAEASGFESVWVMDHFYQLPPLGGPAAPMLESYTLLGGLAARTSRIRLGTMVTGVTYRNPALLAKIVTTLDVISAGRAMLGIGAAWYDVEHEGLGFDFPPAGDTGEAVRAAVFFGGDCQVRAMTSRQRLQPDQGSVQHGNVSQQATHDFPSSLLALAPCAERRLPDRQRARSLGSSG